MPRVQALDPGQAAAELAGLASLDPRGLVTEADIPGMCRDADCWAVETDQGRAVVVTRRGPAGLLWVEAAHGHGSDDMTAAIDEVLRHSGARSVAFQTRRPGLVRRAQRLGFSVAGFIMKRDQSEGATCR